MTFIISKYKINKTMYPIMNVLLIGLFLFNNSEAAFQRRDKQNSSNRRRHHENWIYFADRIGT